MKDGKVWDKFYECNCHSEGVMLSFEDDLDDGAPVIDLAFFSHGDRILPLSSRLKWIWKILSTGQPFSDMVMLDQKTAQELGEDLIAFSQRKYPGDTNVKIIRSECDNKIKKLQERCVHPVSTWCENQFAPGHLTGSKSKVCNICEKVLETLNDDKV